MLGEAFLEFLAGLSNTDPLTTLILVSGGLLFAALAFRYQSEMIDTILDEIHVLGKILIISGISIAAIFISASTDSSLKFLISLPAALVFAGYGVVRLEQQWDEL